MMGTASTAATMPLNKMLTFIRNLRLERLSGTLIEVLPRVGRNVHKVGREIWCAETRATPPHRRHLARTLTSPAHCPASQERPIPAVPQSLLFEGLDR